MQFKPTIIPGAYEILHQVMEDKRGRFVKTFDATLFRANDLATNFAECFYSISKQGVLRGMHFQLPPHAHVKLVYCVAGEVLDVLVDLRVGSPAYGVPAQFILSHDKANMLYIPVGVAHGFYTLSASATMCYMTATVYNVTSDAGISWKSFAIWPNSEPLLSVRDNNHPLLKDFVSPFQFKL